MHLQSFIRGMAVGFILGVLYAPERGEETRRRISKKAYDVKSAVKNTYNTVSNTVTKVKDKANEILHKGDNEMNTPSMGTSGSGIL
jgi:gas vesicle protein